MPDKDNFGAVLQPYNIVFNDSNGKRKDRLNGGLYINKTEVSTSLTQAESDTKILTNVHAVAVVGQVDWRTTNNDSGQVSQTLKTDLAHQSGPCLAVTAPTLTATNDPSRSPQSSEITQQVAAVHSATMQVRRLTPTECERLQGFPDGWTAIPWKKKDAEDCPDGPRYKALGNSMAVNCMEWLGERIQKFDQSSLCQLP
jgi:site-specific DNA-cytosine methylase